MTIDPTIAAAIVTASGGVLKKVLERAVKPEPSADAAKTIDKTYAKLSTVVTTNSVRVLIALRKVASKQSPGMLLPLVESIQQRQEPTGEAFEADLTYRLNFLCLLGLVMQTQGEYAITQLGVAFLAQAAGDQTNYTLAFV